MIHLSLSLPLNFLSTVVLSHLHISIRKDSYTVHRILLSYTANQSGLHDNMDDIVSNTKTVLYIVVNYPVLYSSSETENALPFVHDIYINLIRKYSHI